MSSLSCARTLCVLALIFAVFGGSQSRSKVEFIKRMNATVDECRTQLEIPDGNLTQFFLESKENNLKCELMKCVDMKILGSFQTLDERLEKSVVLIEDMYAENDDLKNKVMKIFQKCAENRGSDDCESMLKITRCCMIEAKELKNEIKKFFRVDE